MAIETISTILIAAVPAISAVLFLFGGIIKIVRVCKEAVALASENNQAAIEKINNLEKQVGLLKTKLTSLEKCILKDKEKK